MALDGTLWVEDGQPYLVFCHERVKLGDGTIVSSKLSKGLSSLEGDIRSLLKAYDVSWVQSIGTREKAYVTDGCYLYRTKTGKLLMIWSSFGGYGYFIKLATS